jgi:glutathionyl-hydroquinone reductase
VYYLLDKCNLHRLAGYRHLWNYARAGSRRTDETTRKG